jgi:hypothetical protein
MAEQCDLLHTGTPDLPGAIQAIVDESDARNRE